MLGAGYFRKKILTKQCVYAIMNKLDAAKERLSISLEDIMSAITDARADVLEAVARGILIQSAMLWMRPQSRLIAAYSIEPPYGRVVEMRHGLDGVELHEKAVHHRFRRVPALPPPRCEASSVPAGLGQRDQRVPVAQTPPPLCRWLHVSRWQG